MAVVWRTDGNYGDQGGRTVGFTRAAREALGKRGKRHTPQSNGCFSVCHKPPAFQKQLHDINPMSPALPRREQENSSLKMGLWWFEAIHLETELGGSVHCPLKWHSPIWNYNCVSFLSQRPMCYQLVSVWATGEAIRRWEEVRPLGCTLKGEYETLAHLAIPPQPPWGE